MNLKASNGSPCSQRHQKITFKFTASLPYISLIKLNVDILSEFYNIFKKVQSIDGKTVIMLHFSSTYMCSLHSSKLKEHSFDSLTCREQHDIMFSWLHSGNASPRGSACVLRGFPPQVLNRSISGSSSVRVKCLLVTLSNHQDFSHQPPLCVRSSLLYTQTHRSFFTYSYTYSTLGLEIHLFCQDSFLFFSKSM